MKKTFGEFVLSSAYSLQCVRTMKGIVKNNRVQILLETILSPFGMIKYVIRSTFPEKEKKQYEHQFAMVAIIKNEKNYIKEWLEFYKLIGVDIFYIYDNDSTDNVKEYLQEYIRSGEVIYQKMSGKKRQCDAYNDALYRYKDSVKYMAFFDLDEFLFPAKEGDCVYNLVDELMKSDSSIGGLVVNWLIYGSSGIKEKQDALVMETFLKRAEEDLEENKHYKTIVNPRRVFSFICPHYPMYLRNFHAVNENLQEVTEEKIKGSYEKLRLNHYFTKSLAEYQMKKSRGMADRLDKRAEDDFKRHDKNDVYDDIALSYVAKIKA